MSVIKDYIRSGILEAYVLGMSPPEEVKEVEEMAALHDEIRSAIDQFSDSLESFAQANAVAPDPIIKPMLMAIIDYTERMQQGECPTYPPILHESSLITDYDEWLNRPDMVIPKDFEDIHAKVIGYSPEVMTAIVWIKHMAPNEVHNHELEKFLIVEGTCDLVIGNEVYPLVPGNFLSIPLYVEHSMKVTSLIPCKIILQRVAA